MIQVLRDDAPVCIVRQRVEVGNSLSLLTQGKALAIYWYADNGLVLCDLMTRYQNKYRQKCKDKFCFHSSKYC